MSGSDQDGFLGKRTNDRARSCGLEHAKTCSRSRACSRHGYRTYTECHCLRGSNRSSPTPTRAQPLCRSATETRRPEPQNRRHRRARASARASRGARFSLRSSWGLASGSFESLPPRVSVSELRQKRHRNGGVEHGSEVTHRRQPVQIQSCLCAQGHDDNVPW